MSEFADAFRTQNLKNMNQSMKEIVQICISSFDSGKKKAGGRTQPENYSHGLTTGLIACLFSDYTIHSNGESGFGRYGLSIIPRDRMKNPFAAILSFKVFGEDDQTILNTAQRALQQIERQAYDTVIKQLGFDDAHILKNGFGLRGKQVKLVQG